MLETLLSNRTVSVLWEALPRILSAGLTMTIPLTLVSFTLAMVLAVAVAAWMAVDALNERGVVVRERLEARALPLRWAAYILGAMIVLIFGVYGPGFDAASFIYGGF